MQVVPTGDQSLASGELGMKERPILMTPENAQKCFDGSKTQTRRIVKPQPEEGMKILGPEMYTPCRTDKNGEMYPGEDVFGVYSDDGEWGVACPYGVPGDRLWIREACWIWGSWRKDEVGRWHFIEGKRKEVLFDRSSGFSQLRKGDAGFGFVRRPGIFMPRWACRTVVDITEIRVQRIQDVTQLDALHEGCEGPDHKANFFHLWTSINGADSWNENPWVFALSFRRIDK